ncbi:MAG: hypothetical protein HY556_00350 [Euryarchaeota archaeon]|nr:hypothetical protein [Euryarchaeota archaeon]
MERAWVFESNATVDEFTRPFNRALVIRGWTLKAGKVPGFIAARGLSTVVFRIDYDARGLLVRARIKSLLGGAKAAEADLVWAGQSAQLTIQTHDAACPAPDLPRARARAPPTSEAGRSEDPSREGPTK